MSVEGSVTNKGPSDLQQSKAKQFVIVIDNLRKHDVLAVLTWNIHHKDIRPLKRKHRLEP